MSGWDRLQAGHVTWIVAGLVSIACAAASGRPKEPSAANDGDTTGERSSVDDAPAAQEREAPDVLPLPESQPPAPMGQFDLAARYDAELKRTEPLDFAALEKTLPPAPEEHTPDFDVSSARYWDKLQEHTQLTASQKRLLQERGLVSVSMGKDRSMGHVYRHIWEAELPVLITSDSVLHAWHRTFDEVLKREERTTYHTAYWELLRAIRAAQEQTTFPRELQHVADHLDLYVAVALSLLGDEPDRHERNEFRLGNEMAPPRVYPLQSGLRSDFEKVLRAIEAQKPVKIPLFGDDRRVDFSQFKPRGHYTEELLLTRYFRALMWMGRADTGFGLVSDTGTVDVEGARAALLLAYLANQTGKLEEYAEVARSIDYFVGAANGLSLDVAGNFVDTRGIDLASLADEEQVSRWTRELIAQAPRDRVTSQALIGKPGTNLPPVTFQLSSQRFTLGSFVHDRLSYDDIFAKRTMVDALDVPAALGNDEATRLLKGEIERYAFARELSAMRGTIAGLPEEYWRQNVYSRWLGALRTLDDPPESPHVPQLFRGRAWQRKQLVTQLASWAELRRDTILYVAQTYSGIICDFPEIYVEPYPEFFARLSEMAESAAQHLKDPKFFRRFSRHMKTLERVARAEVAGTPPRQADVEFIASLVNVGVMSMGCTTEEVWTGWYKDLFIDANPRKFEPIVADVFTDPNGHEALNVATTGAQLGIIAIDTSSGPSLFLGPISGYRQFTGARRNDAEWRKKVLTDPGPPPQWAREFHAGTIARLETHQQIERAEGKRPHDPYFIRGGNNPFATPRAAPR